MYNDNYIMDSHEIITPVLAALRSKQKLYGEGIYKAAWDKQSKETIITFFDIEDGDLMVRMTADMEPDYQQHEDMDAYDLVYLDYRNVKLTSITLDRVPVTLEADEMRKLTEFFNLLMIDSEIVEYRIRDTMVIDSQYAELAIDKNYTPHSKI